MAARWRGIAYRRRVGAADGRRAILIQQFIPEIQMNGEISFAYIDGAFSHAVLKRPAPGDFRVQQEHGGSARYFSFI